MAWLPVVIYVPALAFNQGTLLNKMIHVAQSLYLHFGYLISVTGVNIHVITPIVCIVCIFYTSLVSYIAKVRYLSVNERNVIK